MASSETGSASSGLGCSGRATVRPSRRRFLRGAAGAGAALLAARAGITLADPVDYLWVSTTRATPLRLGADGADVRRLPRGILLRIVAGATGPRLNAWCPAFATFGTVEAAAVEPAAEPSEAQLLAQRVAPVLPPVLSAGELPARVVGTANVRTWPEDRPDNLVRRLGHNSELRVVELVQGEDGDAWYRVSDAAGGPNAPRGAAFFVHNSFVRAPRTDFHPTLPNPDRLPPKWFEADLEQPTLLTAYEAGRAVWSSLALHGKPPNVTPTGDLRVLW